jgi:hypothetical protein
MVSFDSDYTSICAEKKFLTVIGFHENRQIVCRKWEQIADGEAGRGK